MSDVPDSTAARAGAPLLEVSDLKTHFPIFERRNLRRRQVGAVRAVDGISFDIYPGETVGLVGESGSGKSTVARSVMRLVTPTAGEVRYEGKTVDGMNRSEMLWFRRNVQMIFQDPYASLNPRMNVRDIISEPWRVHGGVVEPDDHDAEVRRLLDQVGLRSDAAMRYPREFSGGQRQRIGIARALALRPRVLLCDEPVSALDVSVQAQVINLLEDLQDEFGLSYLFIAHDLSVVQHISDRVFVMYLGKVVEAGHEHQIYHQPEHPYTQALLSAVPSTDLDVARSADPILLPGELPSPSKPPSGCNFRTRCWKADDYCAEVEPELEQRFGDQVSACHYAGPLDREAAHPGNPIVTEGS